MFIANFERQISFCAARYPLSLSCPINHLMAPQISCDPKLGTGV